jgi:hypothetical protein
MAHGLRLKRSHTRLGWNVFLDSPSRAQVEVELARLTRAIAAADGALASEAVYDLSRLFRQTLRERSLDSGRTATAQTPNGGDRS